MTNEETKAFLNKFLKEREERIKNMTLVEARNIVSSIYGHSDMRMESDKALQMLLDCADKALEQQPSERLKGKWITWKEAGNYIPSETRFECSVCHDAAQTLCNGLDLLSPYCPNCGSHNGGEEDEQDTVGD